MKPVYKPIKVLKEHCPVCKEELRGNNSYQMPWYCDCGTWEPEQKYPFTGEYTIKKQP